MTTTSFKEFNARNGAVIGTLKSNYIKISGGTTTTDPTVITTIATNTSYADINLNLIPAGTGYVTVTGGSGFIIGSSTTGLTATTTGITRNNNSQPGDLLLSPSSTGYVTVTGGSGFIIGTSTTGLTATTNSITVKNGTTNTDLNLYGSVSGHVVSNNNFNAPTLELSAASPATPIKVASTMPVYNLNILGANITAGTPGTGSFTTFTIPDLVSMSADTGSIDVVITPRDSKGYDLTPITSTIKYSVSRSSTTVVQAPYFYINTTGNSFTKNVNGSFSPPSITITTTFGLITGITYQWYKNGTIINLANTSSYTIVGLTDYAGIPTNTYSCTATGTYNGSTISITDYYTIPINNTGSTPAILLYSENVLMKAPATGYATIVKAPSTSNDIQVYDSTGALLQYGTQGANTFSCHIIAQTNVNVGVGSSFIPAKSLGSNTSTTTGTLFLRDDQSWAPVSQAANSAIALSENNNNVTLYIGSSDSTAGNWSTGNVSKGFTYVPSTGTLTVSGTSSTIVIGSTTNLTLTTNKISVTSSSTTDLILQPSSTSAYVNVTNSAGFIIGTSTTGLTATTNSITVKNGTSNTDLILTPAGNGTVSSAAAIYAKSFESSVGTGTAPIKVASTTVVDNLTIYGKNVTGTTGTYVPAASLGSSVGSPVGSKFLRDDQTWATANIALSENTGSIALYLGMSDSTAGNWTTGNVSKGFTYVPSSGTLNVSGSSSNIVIGTTTTGLSITTNSITAKNGTADTNLTLNAGVTTGEVQIIGPGRLRVGAGTNYIFLTSGGVTAYGTDANLQINGQGNGYVVTGGKFKANVLESSVVVGTAPLIIASTTPVDNLNILGANVTSGSIGNSYVPVKSLGSGSATAGNLFLADNSTWKSGNIAISTEELSANKHYIGSSTSVTSGDFWSIAYMSTNLYYYPVSGTLNASIFNSTSDKNKKTDIKQIENALNIISGINGVTFKWKENNLKSAGLIAQDVEKYLPELVNSDDDVKSLNYNGIIGVLVEAVKELTERVKILEQP